MFKLGVVGGFAWVGSGGGEIGMLAGDFGGDIRRVNEEFGGVD